MLSRHSRVICQAEYKGRSKPMITSESKRGNTYYKAPDASCRTAGRDCRGPPPPARLEAWRPQLAGQPVCQRLHIDWQVEQGLDRLCHLCLLLPAVKPGPAADLDRRRPARAAAVEKGGPLRLPCAPHPDPGLRSTEDVCSGTILEGLQTTSQDCRSHQQPSCPQHRPQRTGCPAPASPHSQPPRSCPPAAHLAAE